jgi:uncharacterized lipoprotein YmbA
MRTLLLVAVAFACALMGWLVYTRPTSAGSDMAQVSAHASQPDQSDLIKGIGAVSEEKREQASMSKCNEQAASKKLGLDDKIPFLLQCLRAADSGPQDHRP